MPDATDAKPLVLTLGCQDASRALRKLGFETSSVRSLQQLMNRKSGQHARVILINRGAFAEADSVGDIIGELRRIWPLVDIVVLAAKATPGFVREALQAGAKDVLLTSSSSAAAQGVAKVLEEQQLLPRAQGLADQERKESTFEGMVSRNAKMRDLFDTAARVAPTDAAILLLGETGTGKELFARAIHRRSHRPGRFVAINCAAVADDLIDSELFGHVAGAFTGATRDKDGLFRYAEGGTLMLDEIGNIKLAGQHRLLRTLQEGAVRPVGGHGEVPIDVRVIAATSVRLEEEVQNGRFREDLFYRLDVIRLEIPPLRERPEDVVYLFGHFARTFAAQYNVERPAVTAQFLDALVEYEWPGNVRQLENVTERLILTSPNKKLSSGFLRKVLPFRRNARSSRSSETSGATKIEVDAGKPMRAALSPHVDRLEREYLSQCLRRTQGRITEAAEHAGISRRTLLRKLKQHGLDKKDFRTVTGD
jgi:DNA-binding NtrC family response regulator